MVSAPLRRARDLGRKWEGLGVVTGKADCFTSVIDVMVLGLPCFYLYLWGGSWGGGKDCVVFILYFMVQNAQCRSQRSRKTLQGFMG